ncbi:MAG: glutathione peroxidase [bacterium]|nr:glutathione peroxidase [bacterium]
MKKYFYTIFFLAFTGVLIYSLSEANATKTKEVMKTETTTFYDLKINSIDGKKQINMKEFKGKYVLCVNVASECGYTQQYAGLQELSSKYKDKLVVIGFPCNQFLGQEPGTAQEIQTFCKKNYGVTFLLSEKIEVKGSNAHPIYKWLTQKALNSKEDVTIKWNFNKILIDPNGNWLKYFPSGTEPMNAEITKLLN